MTGAGFFTLRTTSMEPELMLDDVVAYAPVERFTFDALYVLDFGHGPCVMRCMRAHVDPTQRAQRGTDAADVRRGQAVRQEQAVDELQRLALWLMAQRIPELVARLALDCGLPEAKARELYDLSLTRAAELADDVREAWMGLPPGELGPWRKVKPPALDWAALSAPGRGTPSSSP